MTAAQGWRSQPNKAAALGSNGDGSDNVGQPRRGGVRGVTAEGAVDPVTLRPAARTSRQLANAGICPRRQFWPVLAGLLLLLTAACGKSGDATDAAPSGSPAASSPEGSASPSGGLKLVALGDSIPYNSPEDCPGCTGFVDLYADAVAGATGQPVEVTNLSDHTGLTLPDLLGQLDSFTAALAEADVIVVGIAHNSIELNAAKPCGAVFDEASNTLSDWSKVDAICASESAASYRKDYDELFATIAATREGRPTILRTLNKYSDWIGWEDGHLTPAQEKKTVLMHDAWNDMLCQSAERNGFGCVDVYHAFNGPSGSKPAGDLLAADYTHPSQAGNDRIAQLLADSGYAPLSKSG